MGWIVLIIIVLGIIGSFSGNDSDGTSNSNSGNKSSNSGNSKFIKERHKALLEEYGVRDTSKGVIGRNRDIIFSYLKKLRPGYHSIHSDSDFEAIKNCYIDIYTIEGYGYLLDNPEGWKTKWNITNFEKTDKVIFKGLYDAIVGIFEQRFKVLGFNFGIKSKYLNKTYDFSLDIKDIDALIGKIIGDIKQRDSKYLSIIEQILDKINIQRGNYGLEGAGLYDFDTMADIIQTNIIDNEFINNENPSLDQVVETVFGRYFIGVETTNEEYDENIESIIDDVLKKKLPKISLKVDGSFNDSNRLIEGFFMNKLEDLLLLNAISGETLYFEEEEKILTSIKQQIDDKSKELIIERSKLIEKIKDMVSNLIIEQNKAINEMLKSYEDGERVGVECWAGNVLKNIRFDDIQAISFDLSYDNVGKILIIEYNFPCLEKIPTYKDVSKTGKILRHSDTAMKKLYDKYILSMCVRILYEIYNNDLKNYVDGIVFNGIVTSIDKSNGHERTDCILSVSTEKKDIKDIVLENIDPKETIRSLHGVCATSLSTLTPVAPISTIDKNDKRFVEGYNVIDSLDDSVNIACMDWQDFENLIRDLFEKIYGEKGGEVKVTQASRDGGVDAVAFDPDPVTGGKILIQAKRYTNVVGVGAVRDLAGAVHHEGAMKGILVTTSNFGSDAMKFVAKEPISLINGQNLLSLLNKYGYHAHIDIKEARKILKEEQKKSQI